MNKNAQSGNAIVMILVAVALFAALGYAFSNTSRTSTNFISDEEAKAYANQIIAYGSEVKSAVKRLQLRGCKDTEISFENSVDSNYVNPNAPSNKSCHVFDTAGGGLTWFSTNDGMLDQAFEAGNLNFGIAFYIADFQVEGNGEDCAQASCSELTLVISDLKLPICEQINSSHSISSPADETITNYRPQGFMPVRFTGTYTYVNVGSKLGDEMTALNGKPSGCFTHAYLSTDAPTFYQVLIAR